MYGYVNISDLPKELVSQQVSGESALKIIDHIEENYGEFVQFILPSSYGTPANTPFVIYKKIDRYSGS